MPATCPADVNGSRVISAATTLAISLASCKKPVGLVVPGELPRNASGKVLKHELGVRYGLGQNGGSSV